MNIGGEFVQRALLIHFHDSVSTLTHNIDIAILFVCPSVTFRYSMEMA